ncbi:MAG TPA: DUF3445 domain-containing protein [Beijerinckiaceae bacterium]|nr:DUF3445 domain-containing protein [Beijerinckiaceae bacterium]
MTRRHYGAIIERLVPDGAAPATGTLPRETLYLPFAAGPYRLAMGLVPLESGPFEIDGCYPSEMALRSGLLADRRRSVLAAMPGSESARHELLAAVARRLSTDHAMWFSRDGSRLRNLLTDETWDLASPALDPLEIAGRLVQEDLCILQPGADGPVLTAAILCFPSHWRLSDKIGRGIAAIHAPVPGFEDRLAAPVGRVLAQLPAGRCLARLNWALDDDPRLHQPHISKRPAGDHDDFGSDRSKVMNVTDSKSLERDAGEKPVPTFSHPAPEKRVTAENAGDSLFLRVERQTLSRLPASGAVLFAIRVHVYPLASAITTRATAARLAAAVHALPQEVMRYKRLASFREPLLGWLDGVGEHFRKSE